MQAKQSALDEWRNMQASSALSDYENLIRREASGEMEGKLRYQAPSPEAFFLPDTIFHHRARIDRLNAERLSLKKGTWGRSGGKDPLK